MSYQSEAQLEQQLIEQLQNQNYKAVSLPDYDTLLDNFKEQFEAFNSAKLGGKSLSPKEWERVLNYINGKSIFESAKLLRDKFVLERDDGTKPYLQFLDEDYTKNRYQVTHQTTVVGKYTIWHTTGAGKTLTSFKTAQILASMPNIKKVIFLVDRKDLDTQTTEEFNKFEAGSVDATDRTDILVKQMKDKNRQLIITTIQKMATAVKKPQYAKVMDLYRDEKVVIIIDECHRSQFGDMHKDIVRHFQKAQFFGFTGTPRFEVNGKVEGKVTQTTEKLFGECLHSYLIKDAIFDNNVLGFHIEYITTMKGAYDENDSTMTEAIDVGELYMADERMTMVANHIVQNHKAKTRNRQYTAIFAVSSIPMLVKYYDIFKSIDHDLNISGIFSYGANEDYEGHDEHSRDALERIISDYNKTFSTNFSTDTFSAYHKDISDRMKGKKTKQLDILIVVNMFLTGFDSKPLSVLYVDKVRLPSLSLREC